MHHQPTAEIINVTPELAKAWLNQNTKNRPLRNTGLNRYAELMKRGAWALGPDAIAFDTNNQLVNGQHRLKALVLSNTTQPFIVTHGLNPDAFPTFDGGFKRGLSDHLATLDYKSTTLLASIARVTANIARAGIVSRSLVSVSNSGNRLENDELIEFVDAYRDELEAATRMAGNIGNRSNVLPATVAGVLAAIYGTQHDIARFITQVCEGVGIEDRRQPAYLLRKKLEPEYTQTARVVRPPRFEVFAYAFIAANLYVAGETRAMLKWVPTTQSPFPQPNADLAYWRNRMPDWEEEESEEPA